MAKLKAKQTFVDPDRGPLLSVRFIVAIALVVIGAVWRLQAPLVLGSVVLLIHGIAQLWPWISSTYVYVPWWLWLGIGGALLIYLAARYESSMRALRTSFTAVASLR